jgi:hypothetical protein
MNVRGSKLVILAAVAGNAAIAVIKLIAAAHPQVRWPFADVKSDARPKPRQATT